MRIADSQCGPLLRSIKARVVEDSLEAIQSLCQASLNLRCLSIHSTADRGLDGDYICQTVAQYCPLIESLSTAQWDLTDAGLGALATVHNLKELKVSNFECISASIQRVLQANPNISIISLEGDYIDDALVRCIGRCSGSLRSLHLYSCDSLALSDDVLRDLFRGCLLLEVVELRPLDGDPTATLRDLFYSCQQLVELDVFVGALPEVAPLVAEPVLYTYYPTLTLLKVSFGGVATSALHDIFTYCTNLREVHINYCHQATDDTIRGLVQHCHNLVAIHLMCCTNVSIAGVLEVATMCTSLMRLVLTCMRISDEVLIQVSRTCLSLTSLSLYSSEVRTCTDAGILAILERCPDLTYLTIHGSMVMPLLSTLDLHNLTQLYPRVNFEIRP